MQTQVIRILMIDIDGVLIAPRGYREAIHATLGYFGARMGFRNLSLDEDIIALYESRGIFSEWDILPLSLAAILDGIQAALGESRLPDDLERACEQIKTKAIRLPEVDYCRLIERLAGLSNSGTHFSDLALSLNKDLCAPALFPNLLNSPLIAQVLADTRRITNPVVKIFQEFVLGKEMFQRTYGLESRMGAVSYLKKYDCVQLSTDWSQRLKKEWSQKSIRLVVYTARPSSGGVVKNDGSLEYSPEAEMALEAANWEGVPLIGLGEVGLAAERIGCSPNRMVKPSPIQALGAILAAMSGKAVDAMIHACQIFNEGGDTGLGDQTLLEVHIFDDTRAGIEAVSEAVRILQSRGVQADMHAYGITENIDKAEQLCKTGALLYPNFNEALGKCYSD